MSEPVIVIGAGGHGGVLADALLAAGAAVLGFTDAGLRGPGPCGLRILGDDAVLAQHDRTAVRLVNGLGGVGQPGQIETRRALQLRLEAQGWRFVGVRHPSAIVSPHASVAPTAQLLAGCIVQAGARIGAGCIVNTGAIVEHDVQLGDWSHLAPRALLCGGVTVGTVCHVGAGAVIRQALALAAGSIVGAGAVVAATPPHAALLLGVPARVREERA